MNIYITNDQTDFPIDEEAASSIVKAALSYMHVECEELSLQFVTEECITKLHGEFFNDPTPTDCITFPIDPPEEKGVLGEVFVCPKTALEYAAKNGLNPEEETILYICHGILHLLGYDDIDDQERIEMREKESFLLNLLKNDNLLHLSSN